MPLDRVRVPTGPASDDGMHDGDPTPDDARGRLKGQNESAFAHTGCGLYLLMHLAYLLSFMSVNETGAPLQCALAQRREVAQRFGRGALTFMRCCVEPS